MRHQLKMHSVDLLGGLWMHPLYKDSPWKQQVPMMHTLLEVIRIYCLYNKFKSLTQSIHQIWKQTRNLSEWLSKQCGFATLQLLTMRCYTHF